MVLDQKNCAALVCGALSVREEDGWLSFSRFTEEQTVAFSGNTDWLMKTGASAGVTLRFCTDARTLSFDYRVERGSSRSFYTFDLWIDGKFASSQGGQGVPGNGSCVFPLGDGEKEVELYLPCLSVAYLRNITLDGDVKQPTPRGLLLFLGDSITQGYDAERASFCYPARICRALGKTGLNQGVGGAVFSAITVGSTRFCAPERIFVAYGTNDWFIGRTDYAQAARDYFVQVRKLFPDVPMTVITPIWRADHDAVTKAGSFADAIAMVENACKDLSPITVADGLSLVGHDPALFGDGFLHPNEAGFAQYAENLLRYL